MDQVIKSYQNRGIKREHVFWGGEDSGAYADNFIAALLSDNWLVAGANAWDEKKHGENKQSSTDMGIKNYIPVYN